MLVLHEVAGIIEIDIVVSVAICETLDVVEATHGNDAVDQMRVAEGEIDGVVCAETGARGHEEGIRVMFLAERQDLVQVVVIVLHVPPRPLSRRAPPGVPAFAVNAIHTKYLNPAFLQVLPYSCEHARILPLEETAQ